MNICQKVKNAIGTIQRQGIATLWNTVMVRRASAKMPDRCPALPFFAQIEITNSCNLRCATCREFVDEMGFAENKPKHLALEEFKTILSQLPYLRTIRMNGVGEPLLNPELVEMIQYARQRDIQAHFFTNATLLKGKIAERLASSGVNNIIFSIDGATPETFEAIRKGAKMANVIENIRNFVSLVQKKRHSYPQLTVMTTLSKNNVHEIPQIVELVHSLGISNLMFKRMIPWTDALRTDVVTREELNVIRRAQTLADQFRIKLIVGKLLEAKMLGNAVDSGKTLVQCNWPWTSTYISVEGWVTPCCNLFDPAKINFGNIFQEDFRNIWNSSHLRDFRAQLRNGLPGVCHNACSLEDVNN